MVSTIFTLMTTLNAWTNNENQDHIAADSKYKFNSLGTRDENC